MNMHQDRGGRPPPVLVNYGLLALPQLPNDRGCLISGRFFRGPEKKIAE